MKYIGENAIKKLIALIKGDLAKKQNSITVSGLLKGDGTTISAAVAGTDYMTPTDVNSAITTIISKSGLIDTTIPKGRMRGDVDGDGQLTDNDRIQISKHVSGSITLTGADFWCADINGDGKIKSADASFIRQYLNGVPTVLTKTPTFADYYNNWTYHKVDDTSGYWTTDIIINELSNSALKYKLLMAINGHFAEGMFYKIERSAKSITTNGQAETKTVLTIYSKYPPIEDTKCLIYYSEDSNISADTYTIIVDTLVTEAEIEAQLPIALPDSTITSTWNSITV